MTTTTPVRPATRPPFALLAAVTVTAISAYTLVPPVLPDIAAEFDVGATDVGLVLAATTLPGILLSPLVGVLADRYGRRGLLAASLVVFGLGGAAAAAAPTFAVLVAARLVQGVGAAGLIGLVVTLIGDGWSGPDRARMMGRNAAALTVAIVVLPPVGGALGALGGWRLALAPYPVAVLAAVVVWWVLPARAAPVAVSLGAQLRAAATALRRPAVATATVRGALAFLLLFGLVLTVLPEHLAALGLGAAGRGLLLALPGLPSAAAALGLGRLTARFGSGALLRAGFGLWAVAFAVVAVVPTVPGVVACLVLYGLGEGLTLPTLQTVATEAAPPESRAIVVAVFVGASRAGQSTGPLLASGLGAGPAFAAGAALAALLTLTAARPGRLPRC